MSRPLVTLDGLGIAIRYVTLRTDDWNGYPVPVTTAKRFQHFIEECRAADPNGTWGEVYVRVRDNALVLTRNDSDDSDDGNVWPVHTFSRGLGFYLYAIDGWTWIKEEAHEHAVNGR